MTIANIRFSRIAGYIAVLLACASCASEDMFEGDYSLGRQNISLKVVTSDNPTTRTPGDDNLNENRFVSLDYYFFAENNDERTLLLHKSEGTRLSEGNSTLDVSLHTYTGTLSDADLTALFGQNAADGAQCYVYVLANLDATTRAAVNAKTTLGDIKTVSFQDVNIKNNGKQDCFVMFGGGPVSLTTDATTNIRTLGGNPIMMTRDAAKIVLTVTSVQEELLVKDINDVVTAKWKPLPEQMRVMFYNGVNKSYVHSLINAGSHYVPTNDDDCYFDLTAANDEWRLLIADDSEQPYRNLTHEYPVYSYLADWRNNEYDVSYMILVLPWQEVDPNNNDAPIGTPRPTYYQIETSPTNTYYENYFYHISINVGLLGSFELPEPVKLYSTYMIVPWGNQNVEAKLSEPSYLIVEKPKVIMNNEDEGHDPYISSHPVSEKVTKVEFMDYSNATIYKWTIEKGNYGTVGGNNNQSPLVYKVTRTNVSTNVITEYFLRENGQNYANRQWNNTYQSYKNIFDSFLVSHTNTDIVLTHNIPNNMFVQYDVTVEVTNTTISTPETIVFTQYPPIYINVQRSNGYAWVNNYDNSQYRDNGTRRVWDDRGTTNNNYRLGNFANYRGGVTGSGDNDNPNNYIISVSSFSDETYIIGDPRTTEVNNLTNLNQLSQYHPTNPNGTEDMISPKFVVASSYGAVGGNYYFNKETAEKRCAAYQENGYPAGRWRVPTAAEIKFIMSLSAQGYIPSLFNLGRNDLEGYWCANGKISGDGNAMPYLSDNTTNTAVRCVYDIWYWGEEHSQYATTFHYGDND